MRNLVVHVGCAEYLYLNDAYRFCELSCELNVDRRSENGRKDVQLEYVLLAGDVISTNLKPRSASTLMIMLSTPTQTSCGFATNDYATDSTRGLGSE